MRAATAPLPVRAPMRPVHVAVLGSAIAIGALLVFNRALPIGLALGAIAISLGAAIFVYQQEARGARVNLRLLVVAIGVLMIVAVAMEPSASHDLWSYTMYGRIISAHGASPYTHVPHDFPHDSFAHLVDPQWQRTPSIYGPVFSAFSAVGTLLVGGSALAARMYQQAGAAIAVAVALWLIWRRTGSAAAVMLVGLNPLVIVNVINNGHNDALVGLGILGAVLLAEKNRLTAAALVLGVAALVKVTALLALPALIAWTFTRYGRRAAVQVAAPAVALVGVGYAIAGPAAIGALNADHQRISRASVWESVRALIGYHSSFLGLSHRTWLSLLGLAALTTVAVLAVAVSWRRRHDRELSGVVALSLAAYPIAALYVLSWYSMWLLPVASLTRRRAIPYFCASLGAFIAAVYTVKYRSLPGTVGPGWHILGAYVGPLAFFVAYLVIALDLRPRSPIAAAPRSTASV